MEISGVSIAAESTATTVANEVQKKTQEIQEQTAEQLIEAVPDPDSNVGGNVDVTV